MKHVENGKWVYELSRRLAGRGHDIRCYGIRWWKGHKDLLRDGIQHHGLLNVVTRYAYGLQPDFEMIARIMGSDIRSLYVGRSFKKYVIHGRADTSRVEKLLEFRPR
jgi:hypothetical protein